jgi:hypothetical protein
VKRPFFILLGVFLLLIASRAYRQLSSPAPAVSAGTPLAPHASPEEVSSPTDTTELPVAVESLRLLDAASDAREDLAVIQQLLEEFRRHHDGNPVGDNAEITAALSGANPKKLAYLSREVKRVINADGCLIDRWGHPYFFHANSGKEMEIISPGPDGILHTDDDLRFDGN